MSAPARPAYWLYQWFWTGLDWLYPPVCGGCGASGSRWCPTCQKNSIRISPPVCQFCGQSIRSGTVCAHCQKKRPSFTGLRSWAAFSGPLRQALHRLKYHRDVALGEVFARNLVEFLDELNWSVDLVSPVPLGVARLAERGYNQAALLARPLALAAGLAYRPRALWKVRDTPSQVGLSLEKRRVNVVDAFCARREIVSGKIVLVVDDVTTSGATMDACAQVLLAAGAAQVYGLTLARAA